MPDHMPGSGERAAVTRLSRAAEPEPATGGETLAADPPCGAVRPPALHAPDRLSPSAVLALQHTIGNAATGRLLRQRFVAGSGPSPVAMVVQRDLQYLAPVTGLRAQECLGFFDTAVQEVDEIVRRATGPEATDLRDAVASLHQARADGRVTCWETSGSDAYASYDYATRQIRLHVNRARQANPGRLVHEAIHAVHGRRYSRLSRLYGAVEAAGGTATNRNQAILLRQWRAWTEYWAYRRAVEYDNLRQTNPTFRRNGHAVALQTGAVRDAILQVRELTGQPFEPWSWNPSASNRARRP